MKPDVAFRIVRECVHYKSQYGKWPDPINAWEHMKILEAFRRVRINPVLNVPR